jgi:uncharacterized protein
VTGSRTQPAGPRLRSTYEHVLPPKEGIALELAQGERLRVIQLEGEQVVDMVAFNRDNLRESLSTSYTRNRYIPEQDGPYFPKDRISEGDWLMSTLCRPLMTVTADTPEHKGMHGSHHRMCNRFFFRVYGGGEERDGCHEILARAVAPYGLGPEDVPDSIDLFMNYPFDCELGHFMIKEPLTKAGDYIELRAEMDCLVALSNCPEDYVSACNNGRSKPMRIEVYEEEGYVRQPVLEPDAWLDRELERRGRL